MVNPRPYRKLALALVALASLAAPAEAASLARTASGLLYQSDGSLSGWTSGGGWTAPSAPAYVAFDPVSASLYGPRDDPAEAMGCREEQLYIEGGRWYLWYDAGPSSRGPWSIFLATSDDRGKTWQPRGQTSEGASKATGGTWGGVFCEWVEKRGSVYVRHRAPSRDIITTGADVAGLGAGPFGWDQWTASDPLGPWTAAFEVPLEPGTWADVNKSCNSIVLSAGTYYAAVSSGLGTAGYATSATATGNYAIVGGDQTVLQNPRPDMLDWISEGASQFLSPTFGTWCMLGDGFRWDGAKAFAFRTSLFYSASLTDWSVGNGGFAQHVQKVCPMDGTHQVGGGRHVTGPDGALIYDAATGFVPVTTNADSEFVGPDSNGWHFRRRIKAAMLEPSATPLRYSGSADTTARSLSRTLAHGDLVLECGARLNGVNGGGGSLTVEYRSDGAGNAYRARLAAAGTWSLFKVAGGSETLKATGSGSMTFANDPMVSRLKVSAVGNLHTLSIDGESQVAYTDGSSPITSGTTLSLVGQGVDCDVRCLSARTSDVVTIAGLPPGTSVDVRAHCGFFGGSAIADGTGTASYAHPHYPLRSLDLGGADYTVAGDLWGGDVLQFSGLPATSATAIGGLAR